MKYISIGVLSGKWRKTDEVKIVRVRNIERQTDVAAEALGSSQFGKTPHSMDEPVVGARRTVDYFIRRSQPFWSTTQGLRTPGYQHIRAGRVFVFSEQHLIPSILPWYGHEG